MNRPSSAFGLMLGFLALTMFAVSSTSRSTTVKPAAGFADRAAMRRQAALSRLSAVAVATENSDASNSLADEALCAPDSIELANSGFAAAADSDVEPSLQLLGGTATIRLEAVQLESVRDDLLSVATAQMDGRTYDAVYDRVVLGVMDPLLPAASADHHEETSELSAADVASVFQSVLGEKSNTNRNAKIKSQRRASLKGHRFLADTVVPVL